MQQNTDGEKLIKFSIFNSQFDMAPQPQELTWYDFKELFSTHVEFNGDKKNATHFNGAEFDVLNRCQDNVRALHLLVLDYDDQLTIDQAKHCFQSYEYIGYTSFNHQRSKDGKPPVDKFRIIIPLDEPCPLAIWKEIRHNVADFAPCVDMSCVRLHQPFAIPLHFPEAEHHSWHNPGYSLDWSNWKRIELTDSVGLANANPVLRSEHTLLPDDTLETKKGSIRVGDITEKVSGVRCPFHNDTKPGEFASKSDKGNIYLHCHKCGTIYMEDNKEDSNTNAITDLVANSKFNVRDNLTNESTTNPDQLLSIDEQQPCEPYNRDARGKMLKNKCFRRGYSIMLLYAFEGFGKSYLAYLEAVHGKKIVFACTSNQQAEEQAEGFRQLIESESKQKQFELKKEIGVVDGEFNDITVQFIPSRDYLLKTKYGIDSVKIPQKNPWEGELANEEQTVKQISVQLKIPNDQAQTLWDDLAPPPFDDTAGIVCTTISRVLSWGKIQEQKKVMNHLKEEDRIITEGSLIFFDDPDRSYLTSLYPYSERWSNTLIGKQPIKIEEIEGRKYFLRPDLYKIGYGLSEYKWIFTTTELLTSQLIKNNYKRVYKPKLMPDNKMIAGNITLIKTPIVRAKSDGVLPAVVQRLHKEGYAFEYIADGQGTSFNLLNNKGQNCFAQSNIVVEISLPHFKVVTKYLDELRWGKNDRFSMSLTLALDDLQQAIGRNSGYRWADTQDDQRKETIVMIEPQLYNTMIKVMRYVVTTQIPDIELTNSKRDYNTLSAALVWYIRNINQYLMSGIDKNTHAFLSDMLAAIDNTPVFRRKQMLKRALIALNEKIKTIEAKRSKNIVYFINELAGRLGKLEHGVQ